MGYQYIDKVGLQDMWAKIQEVVRTNLVYKVEKVTANNVTTLQYFKKSVSGSTYSDSATTILTFDAASSVPLLDSSGKLQLAQFPDAILGQLLYGGTVGANAVATFSTNVKAKKGITVTSATLTNDTGTYGYGKFEAVYFLMDTAQTFAGLTFEKGDWLISIGSAWKKIDNTDAVTSVAGMTGAVTLKTLSFKIGDTTQTTTYNGSAAATFEFGAAAGKALATSVASTDDGLVTAAQVAGYAAPKLSNTIDANTSDLVFSKWNANGLVTGAGSTAYNTTLKVNGTAYSNVLRTTNAALPTIYAPTGAGTSGQYLKSTAGTPTWATFTKPSLAWTGGTSAGPTLKVTTDGGTSDAATIPSASNTASGIVTTGAQTFAGAKTFNGNVVLANNTTLSLNNSATTPTACTALKMTADNEFLIGYGMAASYPTYLYGKTITMRVNSTSADMVNVTSYGLASQAGVSAKGIIDLTVSGGGSGAGISNFTYTSSTRVLNIEDSTGTSHPVTLPLYGSTVAGLVPAYTGTAYLLTGAGWANPSAGTATTNGYVRLTIGSNNYDMQVKGIAAMAYKASLVASDIPSLDASKITSGTLADARIASADTWNGKQDALPTTGTAATTYAINISGAAADYSADGGIATALNDKSDTSHTHKVKINGNTKTIAASSGAAVDLGTYLTAHQSVTLASGTNNGTLKLTVGGTATDNIAVKGLGSFAYISSLAFSSLTNKPTTISGYGITDAKIEADTVASGSSGLGRKVTLGSNSERQQIYVTTATDSGDTNEYKTVTWLLATKYGTATETSQSVSFGPVHKADILDVITWS